MLDTSFWDDRINDLFDEIHAVRIERAEAKRAEYEPRPAPQPPRSIIPNIDPVEAARGAWIACRSLRPERRDAMRAAIQRRAQLAKRDP